MKLLILGGTKFLGRHLVESALLKNWDITLFNRGETNPGLYSHIETITGDRDGGLQGLEGRRWDTVIDTCGYVPRLVGDSARLLSDSVDQYTFVSTVSVYKNDSKPGMREDDPVAVLDDPTTEEINGETYGGLKALSEQAAEREMPGRVLIVRPGLIVGPHDPTDRFSYWVDRIARGGRVLCPGPPDRPVQVIDVRDLASWMIELVQAQTTGLVQASGPTISLLDTLKACPGFESVTPAWVDDTFLEENKVTPWTELPLWIPGEAGIGFMQADTSRAEGMGLSFRPIHETTEATLEWLKTLPPAREWKAGLAADKEATLLQRIS